MQLVEEAIDGCWIGHRARMGTRADPVIGSLYSPPPQDRPATQHVEIVIEPGDRPQGWLLKCERGGIRRVLMNIFGNSLKFTTVRCSAFSIQRYLHYSIEGWLCPCHSQT